MKILAFAATTHKESINKQVINYALNLLKQKIAGEHIIETIDLIDFEAPLYQQDREEAGGIVREAKDFYQKISDADAIIISFAEHNGSYTAVYKNLFDWASRIDSKVYQNKPMVILSASPGPAGGQSVLKAAAASAPFFGMDIKGTASVKSFYDNFDMQLQEVTNKEIQNDINAALDALVNALSIT